MAKILIQLGIILAVVAVFYFFGASLTTCWFTFLIFCGFAGLGDLGDRLYEIERKLDSIAGIQDKSEAWTDTLVHALARIESKVDAIPG
jgi:hypothetical protein